MLHSRTLNNKIDRLYKCCFHAKSNDQNSNFEELPEVNEILQPSVAMVASLYLFWDLKFEN